MSVELGIGVSTLGDVYEAGKQAAEQVVSHLAGRRPHLTLVFSSIRFADPRLLKGIRSVAGDGPLIGCTDAGGISTSGPKRRSVTVVGLVAHSGFFVTALGRHVSHHPLAAGQALAKSLKRNLQDAKALLLFPDGLTSHTSDVLSGVRKVLGIELPIVGGAAADDFFFQKTFQFFNDEILTDSVPAALFCGDIAVGIGVRHGWLPLGRERHVTRSSGHIIYQLDNEPAVSIYEDYLGIKREELMEEPLAHVAMSYPLGTEIPGRTEYLLRDAIRVGRAGSLVCTGDMPEGSTVRLMIGGHESALEAAQQAAYEAAEQVGRRRLKGALVFASVARQKMLGSEFQGEIDVIRDALGGSGVRMGGFYTYGELAPATPPAQAPEHARHLFHNESVVVMALGG